MARRPESLRTAFGGGELTILALQDPASWWPRGPRLAPSSRPLGSTGPPSPWCVRIRSPLVNMTTFLVVQASLRRFNAHRRLRRQLRLDPVRRLIWCVVFRRPFDTEVVSTVTALVGP